MQVDHAYSEEKGGFEESMIKKMIDRTKEAELSGRTQFKADT